MTGRESANAAYMAWLSGIAGLLGTDEQSARSDGGWLAYLAGYLAAENAAAEQVRQLRAALERAYSDLLGFEGHFERMGSTGTARSITNTLDMIEKTLAATAAPAAGGSE